MRKFGAALAAIVLVSCAHVAAQERAPNGVLLAPNVHCATPDCRGYNVDPAVRTHSRYGIGCWGNTPPGTAIKTELPPQSYLASDLGKRGYPHLRSAELAMVRAIQHDHPSKTLRLAWIDYSTTPNNFIVFDATDGPCEVWAGGYQVLNGSCNEFYQPGENPYSTHAVPDCWGPPRPWLSPTP